MAVLIFAGSHVISLSSQVTFLAFGVFVSAAVAAAAQWIASARTKREIAVKVLKAATLVAAVYMLYDCGWMPDWLCFAFV